MSPPLPAHQRVGQLWIVLFLVGFEVAFDLGEGGAGQAQFFRTLTEVAGNDQVNMRVVVKMDRPIRQGLRCA